LAKAKEVFPSVNQINDPSPPAFEGTPDDFLEKYKDEDLKKKAKNKVRKCPSCSKAVAFTLSHCNSCRAELSKVEISFTNNIFVGFMYGIQKGPFPFTVSIRMQSPEYLVFDDLLALCPCHLNIIPTTQYMPDWRYLLKNPKEGKKIVEELFENAWGAVKNQFLANKTWRHSIIAGDPSDEVLKGHIAAGFNYPPSQYQIHLQFMLPPFIPFHYFQYLNGLHFTYNRFFPVEYVRAVLELGVPYDVKEDTPVEDIVNFYESKGVSYHKIHGSCYQRYGASHVILGNWKREDFEGFVVENKFYKFSEDFKGVEVPEEDVKGLSEKDKNVLQNYGRPYSGGKPSGTYYKFAKKVENKDVKFW